VGREEGVAGGDVVEAGAEVGEEARQACVDVLVLGAVCRLRDLDQAAVGLLRDVGEERLGVVRGVGRRACEEREEEKVQCEHVSRLACCRGSSARLVGFGLNRSESRI